MIFKLLVVDDETTMRKGIANFMNWESIECSVAGTASDGQEAIQFITENDVHIVITDIKMPGADGLEVARFVHENYPAIKVIILTGYAEFEYAQTAIRYNVSEFLIKPTNKKSLFEAVKTAQKQIITSKRQTSIATDELAFLKDQLLLELTTQAYSPTFEQRLADVKLRLDHYFIVAFQLIPLEDDIALLKKIIIDEKKHAYCYRYNHLIIAAYFIADNIKAVPDYIIENCREISEIAYNLDSKDVAVGISQYHCGSLEFGTAVSEAIRALSLNFYSEDNIALFSVSSQPENCDLTAENSLELFQFESFLNERQFEDADLILNKIFAKFKSNFVSAWSTKNICSQIYYICSRLLIKKELPAPSGQYLTRIDHAADIFVLKSAIDELLDVTKDSLSGAAGVHNRLVESTIKYIQQNLASPLSLEIIAENLHISPSHLSRTFKRECNESLTEFINRTRIDIAKDYLLNTDILIYEIAELVGYNDAAYFSSIFKKYTGVNSKDYRSINKTRKTSK